MCDVLLNALKDILDTRWETFKELFTLKVMKFFIVWFALAPAVYKLVSQLQSPLPIQFGDTVSHIALEMPFNWQVLWFSSLFYAFSFVLYQLFAPKFIKNYSNFSEYKKAGHDIRWVVWETYHLWKSVYLWVSPAIKKEFFGKLKEKEFCVEAGEGLSNKAGKPPEVEKTGTVFHFEYEGTIWRVETPKNESQEQGLFWEIFGRYSETMKSIRVICRISLYLSFLLFSFVIFMYVVNGLNLAINSFRI